MAKNTLNNDKRGLSLLLVVVIVGSAALIMVLGTSFLGIGEASESFVFDQYQSAQILVDGCVDEALRQLRIDDAYAGGSLVLDEGSCILTVASNASDRTIAATSTIGDYAATAVVELSIVSSTITITSWE